MNPILHMNNKTMNFTKKQITAKTNYQRNFDSSKSSKESH